MQPSSRLILVAAAIALAVAGVGCDSSAQKQRNLEEGFRKVNAEMTQDNAATKEKALAAEFEIYKGRYGFDTAEKWRKCTATPPAKASNQATCKKILDRVNRDNDREAAKEAKAKASW